MQVGLSFSPFNQDGTGGYGGQGGRTRPTTAPIQDAIKILSLRLPTTVGPNLPSGVLASGPTPGGGQMDSAFAMNMLRLLFGGQGGPGGNGLDQPGREGSPVPGFVMPGGPGNLGGAPSPSVTFGPPAGPMPVPPQPPVSIAPTQPDVFGNNLLPQVPQWSPGPSSSPGLPPWFNPPGPDPFGPY